MTSPPVAKPPRAHFLRSETGPGWRFAVEHEPAPGPARAAVVFVHALADEMNRSRRMVALAARRLAADGCAVLQIDLLGCGDSSGGFADATWEHWLADVRQALAWIARRHPGAPLVLWGHRAGCLLATEVARTERAALLFWQPPASGKALLQQFMRLKLAAGLQAGGDPNAAGASAAMRTMRARWESGSAVTIAGYTVSAALAQGLEAGTLSAPVTTTRLAWLEVSNRDTPELLPASRATLQTWRDAGHVVHDQAVNGPQFWQTQEIEDAPELLGATAEAIRTMFPSPMLPPDAASPADAIIPSHDERPIRIACDGEALMAVLHRPERQSGAGVVIVVGGPQYRVGSHRQFVEMARALAAAGHPVLRFDTRGMGDSTGTLVDFEHSTPDIASAITAFSGEIGAATPIVLWGLCDGASAALLCFDRPASPRVAGLVLVNPWVRSAQTLAATQVKHYYGRRLLERDFWVKLVRGGVGLKAMRGLLANLVIARDASVRGAVAGLPSGFQQRMAAGYAAFDGPVLLLLSGDDITAREFEEFSARDAKWQAALRRKPPRRVTLDGADHTFSVPEAQRAAEAATIDWLAETIGIAA